MGTGKSAVGKILAGLAGLGFVDTDAIIEGKTGRSISGIFNYDGEKRFREIEAEIISEVCGRSGQVISTGGGAVTSGNNMERMKAAGPLVALVASSREILKRVGNESHRPLLDTENPEAKIKELLEKRLPYYLQADLVIDTEDKSPEEIAREILKKLKAM